jgi:hypothetical protein
MDFHLSAMNFGTPHTLPPGHIDGVWNHLENRYNKMIEDLPADKAISVVVFLFGGSQIQVREFGYAGPNLLTVHGILNGENITAYVHQSCLQAVFSIVPKDDKKPITPIGFVAEDVKNSSEETAQKNE